MRRDLMLIARSAPGEQPAKLTAALENVIRELDREFQAVQYRHRRLASEKQHERLPEAVGCRGHGWRRDPDAGRAWNLRRRGIDGRDAHSRDRRPRRAGRFARDA